MRVLISAVMLIAFFLVFNVTDANAEQWKDKAKITDTDRRVKGYIYQPGHGRRTQILNERGRVVGYIDRRGQVTNTRRQRVLEIEELVK
jgi:hypothetical protein